MSNIDLIGPPPNDDAKDDVIIQQLSKRAHDLSLSIVNPKTLSAKLRESLLSIAGDKARLYHIGINFDGKVAEVKIAALSPSFVTELNLLSNKSAQLSFAYQKKLDNGWNIQVGVMAQYEGEMDIPRQSNIMSQFSVTISK